MENPQSDFNLKMKTMRPGSYYWRLLGRELDDIEKLKQVVRCLIEEAEVHFNDAQEQGVRIESQVSIGGAIRIARSDSADSLKELIGVLIGAIEAYRKAFRKSGGWPPKCFEASDIAKALLGYDPDVTNESIDEHL